LHRQLRLQFLADRGLSNLRALQSGVGAGRTKHGRHAILLKENTCFADYWLTLLRQAGFATARFHYSTDVVLDVLQQNIQQPISISMSAPAG